MSSLHPGGVNAAFADGSVRFIKNSINMLTWMQLGTKGGRRSRFIRFLLEDGFMTSDGFVTPELAGQGQGQQGESASSRGASEERLGRTRGLLAVGGLLAGLLAFGVGEAVYDLIPAASMTQHALGLTRVTPTLATEIVAAVRNGALAFGVLGLFLGGCLGLAGGLARRSWFAVAAGGLGSVLGFAAGVGASLALLPFCIASRIRYPDNELVISFLMHGAIWGLLVLWPDWPSRSVSGNGRSGFEP